MGRPCRLDAETGGASQTRPAHGTNTPEAMHHAGPFEAAAITLHLADQHPDARLAPPLGTPERAQFYKWMIHLTNTPQAEYRAWFYPEEHVADPADAGSVKKAAGRRLGNMFGVIANQLSDGPWLLGETFSAADLFLLMLIRWGRALPRPVREAPQLAAHARRVLARPAVQAAFGAGYCRAVHLESRQRHVAHQRVELCRDI